MSALPRLSLLRLAHIPGLAAAFLAVASAPAQVAFTDVARAAGIRFVGRYGRALELDDLAVFSQQLEVIQRNMGNGVAVSDYDNDGDFDILFLGQMGHRNVLYQNQLVPSGALGFVDVTAAAGLGDVGCSRVAMFADLDNNGWQDLIIANDTLTGASRRTPNPAAVIYRNNGGTFVDVSASSGCDPQGLIHGGMGLIDYDGDGRTDVYFTNWGALQQGVYTLMPGHNRLYRNLGNFQFQDVTVQVGLGQLESNCFAPIFGDFDNDRDPDLFVAVDGYSDIYYRNDNGTFVNATLAAGATHVGTDMGVAAKDFDHDGDLDLFCSNVTGPRGIGGNTLLVNQFVETGSMTFSDQARARGVRSTAFGWGTEWVDVDNDGDEDLYVVNGFHEFTWRFLDNGPFFADQPAFLFENEGTGFYAPFNPATGAEVRGDARAAVAFDVDRDGDQDLLVTHMNGRPALLRNQTAAAGRWLDLKLVGAGGVNRDAIGARVVVRAGARVLHYEVTGGGSYLSGRPYEIHVGLGAIAQVSRVEVTWPDGHTNVVTNPGVDQRIVIPYQ